MPAPVSVNRRVPQRISVGVMAVMVARSALVVVAVQIRTWQPGVRVVSQLVMASGRGGDEDRGQVRIYGVPVPAQSSHAAGYPIMCRAKEGLRVTGSGHIRAAADLAQIHRASLPPRSHFARTTGLDTSRCSDATGVGSDPVKPLPDVWSARARSTQRRSPEGVA